MKIKNLLYQLVFLLLVLQPMINKLILQVNQSFDVYNELITVLVFLLFVILLYKNTWKITTLFLLVVAIGLYMLLSTLYKGNSFYGIMQFMIYSQFFIYFFYTNILTNESKLEITLKIKKLLDVVFVVILLFSIFELLNHSAFKEFYGVSFYNRGINGFYLISIFGSAPSFSLFLSIYILLIYYCGYTIKGRISKVDALRVVLAVVLCLLTFSRKEVLLTLLSVAFFPYPQKSNLLKYLRVVFILMILASGTYIYYTSFFKEANKIAFSEDYVRWKIMKYSWKIGHDNLPLGSGVGTFGSQMSLANPHVYKEYEVGPEMTGYNGKRGPIYDAFWFTFTAELGIGIFLVILFFLLIYASSPPNFDRKANYIKRCLILFFLFIGFFSPVLVSPYGFMVAMSLGLFCGKINISLNLNNAQFKTNNILSNNN